MINIDYQENKSNDVLNFHGLLGDPNWKLPKLVADCNEEARPGYNSYLAKEYLDEDYVLKEKIKILANLIKNSQNFVVYTGAGISISAGIGDYATKSKDSISGKKLTSVNRLKAIPTKSHYVLVELYKANYLKYSIQQNHDGLAQKSGYP